MDLGPELLASGPVGRALQVEDVGDDTPHWEGFGWIPPQVGPQADREATSERKGLTGRRIGIPPSEDHNGGGGIAGIRYLCLLSPEHSITDYFDQDHYGPVPGGGA